MEELYIELYNVLRKTRLETGLPLVKIVEAMKEVFDETELKVIAKNIL